MPLVHVHLFRTRSPEQLHLLADVVHASILEAFGVPERDRYQLIHQHAADEIIVEDTGLGIDRTDDVVVLQIVSRRRTSEQKQRLYALLAENIYRQCGIAPSDLIATVVENGDADWSFGHGRAQFVTGELA